MALATLLLCTVAAEAREYPYQSCFLLAGQLHDLPLELLLAVAATESNWDPDARSHANAHGIMQIQCPGTAPHLGVRRLAELYNPCLNIELGARYLRELLDREAGDLDRALAAYNYGPTRIARSAVLPAGAQAYANRVHDHRRRIEAQSVGQRTALVENAGDVRFDKGVRAERFAATMNTRVVSAEFHVERHPEGGYAVHMRPAPGGLTLADATTLRTAGWPEAVP